MFVLEFLSKVLEASWSLTLEMAPFLLLGFVIAGIISVFLPIEMVAGHLGGESIYSVVKSVILGVPLPLCSCGVLPVAASLRKSGAGRAPTLAFLSTTPVTGVDSILATYSLLGIFFTFLRILSSVFIGLFMGIVLPIFGEESKNSKFFIRSNSLETLNNEKANTCNYIPIRNEGDSFYNKIKRVFSDGISEVVESIAGSVLIGILIAGLITVLFPVNLIEGYVGKGFLGIVIATLIGVPIYVCATGSIPIAAAMVAKGFSPGAALAFLIAGPATNAVAITTTKKLLGNRATVLYLFVIIGFSLLFGWGIDQLNIPMPVITVTTHGIYSYPLWKEILGGILLLWMAWVWFTQTKFYSFVVSNLSLKKTKKGEETMKEVKILVKDMTCNHCKRTIEKVLMSLSPIKEVIVDLNTKIVFVKADNTINSDEILSKIREKDYTPEIISEIDH